MFQVMILVHVVHVVHFFIKHLCCGVSAIENGGGFILRTCRSWESWHCTVQSPPSRKEISALKEQFDCAKNLQDCSQTREVCEQYHCANTGPGFIKDQSVKNPFVIARRCKSACSSSELSSAAPRFKDSLHTTGLIRALPIGSSMHLTLFDARLENLYNSRPSREEDRNMF